MCPPRERQEGGWTGVAGPSATPPDPPATASTCGGAIGITCQNRTRNSPNPFARAVVMWGREYAFASKVRQYRYTLGNTINAIASEPGTFHSTDSSASTAAGIHRNVPVTMVLSASSAETRSQAEVKAMA